MTATKAIDATRAGQVLIWAPEGVGDFADLAWVLAETLGNGSGVHGLDVHRGQDGHSLFAQVKCDSPAYVRDVAARLGWHLFVSRSYATAVGRVGDVLVEAVWILPHDSDAAPQIVKDEEAGL
jgi:hypothetical protein